MFKTIKTRPSKRSVLWALSACALFIGAVGLAHITKENAPIITIEGLSANETLSYTVNDTQKTTDKNTLTANKRGIITVSGKDNKIAGHLDSLTLTRAKNAPTGTIKIKLNTRNNNTQIKASGLPALSKHTAVNGTQNIDLKSDWSGQVHLPQSTRVNAPIMLTLNTNNLTPDMMGYSPLKIEIFESPGGGGSGDDEVNEYENDDCGDSPSISTCQTSDMDDQIDDIVENYNKAFRMMAEQFSAVMMQYVQIIGSFMDAENQMSIQHEQQKLVAQAHKDYHPSEQMCRFGSFVRSIGKVEQKMALEHQAVNKAMMERYVNAKYAATNRGEESDTPSRLEKFKSTYCDPNDHNGGLAALCGSGGGNKERLNKDIDYTRTVHAPLTLGVNFSREGDGTSDEEDILALANNLYWHKPLPLANPKAIEKDPNAYLDARRVMASSNIAHNTFAHIIALKSESPRDSDDPGTAYMKALMKDFGLGTDEIHELLGDYPSYWAQTEVLTKKIYQNPDFYTRLVDKPVNVKRIATSMDAIKLMQLRDAYKSSTRQEMLNAMMLEQIISERATVLNEQISAESARAANRKF